MMDGSVDISLQFAPRTLQQTIPTSYTSLQLPPIFNFLIPILVVAAVLSSASPLSVSRDATAECPFPSADNPGIFPCYPFTESEIISDSKLSIYRFPDIQETTKFP